MNPILVAIDVPTVPEATALIDAVRPSVGGIKLGLEFFIANGPDGVRAALAHRGDLEFFLDLKLHDIPATVAHAMRSARAVDPTYVTVHATGGRAMLEAANAEKGTIKTLAVTILTSLDDTALTEVGLPKAADAVPMLAALAMDAGCDGVICAPTDVAAVRAVCPQPFLIVTPGVRPAGASSDDQMRVMTPRDAMDAGANRLVIGRPITATADPATAAAEIRRSLLEE